MAEDIEINIPSYIIFDYIVGKDQEHPFDFLLDIHDSGRFECHQTFIYDGKTNLKQVQDLQYLTFFIELDKCRKILSNKKNPRRSEVKRLADELAEIAPKKLCLPKKNLDFDDIEPKTKKKIQEIFGLNKPIQFADFKETEESLLMKAYRKQQLNIYKGLL
jgi:hypothetical protein